jgi:lipopolysaccharide/colanic/teichoic acid biosynthesis glycosyltransferase
MPATKVLKWFKSRKVASRSHADDFLLSRRHFDDAIRRERLRSDRSLTRFTLLTLHFSPRAGAEDTFRKISDILEGRIRETDQAGWFQDRTIGIILPETPPEGAWKLAADLHELLEELRIASPTFSVYVYPTFDSNEGEMAVDSEPLPAEDDADEMPVQPLEVLFLERLPAWKRAMDIVGASLGIVLLSPVFLLTAIAIKRTSRGPVFYRQRRDGLGGSQFWIYKFRTMVQNADQLKADLRAISEQDGPAFKLKNDPRLTPIGQFLRSTSIDELPQLINVLKGNMSLVGPRPLPCDESAACTSWQRERLRVTPGLTCIWQVEGRSRVTFDEWMRMDLKYVRSRRLRNDLKLLFQTVHVVLSRKGAY